MLSCLYIYIFKSSPCVHSSEANCHLPMHYFKNIWIFDTFICQLQWIIICGCTDGNANGKKLVDGQVESAVSMISQDSIFSAQMDYKQPLVSICVIWFFVSVPSRSNQIIFRCVFPFQMLNHSQVASWRLTGHILWSVILTCFVIMLKNVFFKIYFNGQKESCHFEYCSCKKY